ncbi:MAG: recombination mediator RecR [Firmicutes bacterium]|nr:recombination mediator RecR [Ezakiella sp.]MDD7762198.1 recombination mediator RecR [Bacillota bacterium]
MSENIIENLIDRFRKFPSVGRKTAERMAYFVMDQPNEEVDKFIEAIRLVKSDIKKCTICGNYSTGDICSICSSDLRDRTKLMVVTSVRDIDSFERAINYDGLYFVLDADSIDPTRGIGPEELGLDKLHDRVRRDNIKEVIIAFANDIEKDFTTIFIRDMLSDLDTTVTKLSTGLPVGGQLEFADQITLKRSFDERVKF